MVESYEQSSEFRLRKLPATQPDNLPDAEAPNSQAGTLPSLHNLLRNTGLSASYNAPIRAQALQQMQRTHGNRAVQRQVASTPGKAKPKKQGPKAMWDDFMRHIEQERIKQVKADPNPEDGYCIQETKGPDGTTEEHFCPPPPGPRNAPKCVADKRGNAREDDVYCRDPWDEDMGIGVDLRPNKTIKPILGRR